MEESKEPKIQTFDEILLDAEKNRKVLRPISGRSVKGKSNRKNNSFVEFIINTGETGRNSSWFKFFVVRKLYSEFVCRSTYPSNYETVRWLLIFRKRQRPPIFMEARCVASAIFSSGE
jgi:hypothetical protein